MKLSLSRKVNIRSSNFQDLQEGGCKENQQKERAAVAKTYYHLYGLWRV